MMMISEIAITIDDLTTTGALKALQLDWLRLWSRCPGATPFQSPGWLIPWWEHFGQGELRLLTLRHEGRLIGLAPFSISKASGSPVKRVLLMGTGISDYLDVLIEPEFEQAGLTAIITYLDSIRPYWDMCDFQQLRPQSPLLRAESGIWSDTLILQDPCPVLPLPAAGKNLHESYSPHLSQNLHYYRHRAEKMGPVTIERADRSNFDELFTSFIRLHNERWQSNGGHGLLTDTDVQNFYRDAALNLLEAGVLRLYALRLGCRMAACLYGFIHKGRFYYYLGGFDPAFRGLSPGTLLIGLVMEEAILQGATEFDFLRGQETYKYRWGAKDQPNYNRQWRQESIEWP
ncbi:MAG: GNAT family N-acetyltransferase [bacterium]